MRSGGRFVSLAQLWCNVPKFGLGVFRKRGWGLACSLSKRSDPILGRDFVERYKNHVRLVAVLVLLMVCAYGAYELFSGDWRGALSFWSGRLHLLGAALLLHAADISFDCVLWAFVLREFGIRMPVRDTALAFLTGYAGLLLPVQLGRFIRSDSISRLGHGELKTAAKGELVLLFLTGIAALAVLAGIVGFLVFPPLGLLAAMAVMGSALFVAEHASGFLANKLPTMQPGYWWRKRTFVIGMLAGVGWLINGTELYIVVHDIPGNVKLYHTCFMTPANAILGSGTGLPGGVGAIEGLLGVSLSLVDVPTTHLALAVGAYRLVAFWVWIPIGWVAFTIVNRLAPQK